MFAVVDASQLNWWLRRFAPRITLRLSPDIVEIASTQGAVHSAPVLTVIRKGNKTIVVGIGDDPVTERAAIRIPTFSASGDLMNSGDAFERLLRVLLKRLPRSGGFIRPVVMVEGLPSLESVLGGRQREIVTEALATCGAVAAVIAERRGPAAA
jgi:hypothetical protein